MFSQFLLIRIPVSGPDASGDKINVGCSSGRKRRDNKAREGGKGAFVREDPQLGPRILLTQ